MSCDRRRCSWCSGSATYRLERRQNIDSLRPLCKSERACSRIEFWHCSPAHFADSSDKAVLCSWDRTRWRCCRAASMALEARNWKREDDKRFDWSKLTLRVRSRIGDVVRLILPNRCRLSIRKRWWLNGCRRSWNDRQSTCSEVHLYGWHKRIQNGEYQELIVAILKRWNGSRLFAVSQSKKNKVEWKLQLFDELARDPNAIIF